MRNSLKIGTLVNTPHGRGVISKHEEFRLSERFAVKLEDSPFSFPLAYYFQHELEVIELNKYCLCEYEHSDNIAGILVFMCNLCVKKELESSEYDN